jgi:hypothetical protein
LADVAGGYFTRSALPFFASGFTLNPAPGCSWRAGGFGPCLGSGSSYRLGGFDIRLSPGQRRFFLPGTFPRDSPRFVPPTIPEGGAVRAQLTLDSWVNCIPYGWSRTVAVADRPRVLLARLQAGECRRCLVVMGCRAVLLFIIPPDRLGP